MYRLQRNVVVWASLFLVFFMSASSMTQATEIYFSEYSEPNNAAAGVHFNDRYVEIYNGSASQVDMEDYAFVSCVNNCNGTNYKVVTNFTNNTNFPDTVVPSGGVFTVRHSQDANIQTAIKTAADGKTSNLNYNGNDVFALVRKEAGFTNANAKILNNVTVMDVLGAPSNPATFDSVCGDARGLENVTLIKKPGKQGNTDWDDSRGTNATDCDWVVKAANDLTNIGQHSPSAASDTTLPVITLTGNQIVEVALNTSYSDAGAAASDDTDGNITSSISTGGATIDTSVAGTYAVTYNVNDAASNAAVQIVRTVIVDPWNFNNSKQGWSGNAGASVAAGATYATLTLTGPGKNFPNFDSSASANINTAAGKYVAITLKNNSANTKYAMAVMVGTSPKFAATLTSQSTSDADFKTVYFDMKTATAAANWTGTIQQVRFRPTKVDGSTGVAAGTIFIDKIAVVPVKDTTAPTVSAVSIASNNASSTVAGVGNVVTLTMTANEMIKTPVVTFKSGGAAVSDTSVTYTNTSGDTWTAAYTVESGDTAGTVSYSIAFNDTSGNPGTAVTSGSGSVSMDAPPTITKSIVSAVNDGVTALGSVSANETVTWAISGSGVSISSSGVVTLDSAANYLIAASHSFTITATDSAGNVASTGALSVSVVDITVPTITSGIVSSVNDGDTALGSVSANETVTWSITGSGVSISSSGVVTLDSAANAGSAASHSFTVTAVDSAGNSTTTGTLSASVVDTTAPTITSSIESSIDDGSTALGSVSANETVTWSISGSGVSISSSGVVTLDSAANYQTAVSHSFTITATDSLDNVATTSVLTVSVDDITAPTITSSIESSVDDGATALGSVSANETVTWSITGSGVSINSSGVVTLDSAANAGSAASHSFTVTATDTASNATTTGTLSVLVVDTTDPVISLVGSAIVSIELGTAYSDAGATATDNKDGSITSSITTVSDVDVNKVGAYTVTYNVSDVAGNAATQVTRTINVGGDTTIPVISLVGSASVDVERTNPYSDLGATATDNFDGTITSSIVTVSSVDTTTPGTYTVTYDVNDVAGNAAVKVTRVVTVADTTPPGLTVANLNLNVADGATALGSVSADESATWSVTGSGVSISSSGSVALDSPADYLVRTSYSFEITATDAYGNFRRIPVIVVVDDITAPIFDYSGLATSINDGDTALGSVSANEPVTWSISGSGVSISSSGVVTLDSPADYLEAQSYQFRVSATDKQGGAGRHGYDFIVEVIDITAPTIDYSGLVSSINDGGTALGSVSASEPVSWSISGSGVSISSAGVVTLDSPADYVEAQSYQYRVTATDKQGGAGRVGYNFIVEVIDITPPTFDYSGLLGTIYEGTTGLGSIAANEPVNWSVSGSGVSISSSGVVTLDSPASYETANFHKFRISATDKQGGAERTGYFWTAEVKDNSSVSIDLDGNDKKDALTDGLLLVRGMFGLDGIPLVKGIIGSNATYTSSADIERRISMLGELADIDGNGVVDALTDGQLTLRYLFGLEGDVLVKDVVAPDATRSTAEIEAHLKAVIDLTQ